MDLVTELGGWRTLAWFAAWAYVILLIAGVHP